MATQTTTEIPLDTPAQPFMGALVAYEDATFDNLQEIRDISRTEFIALKRELARLRGLA